MAPLVTKIASKDVTDAIAKAMENADRMKTFVIVYETLDTEDTSHGLIAPTDCTLETINYLLDVAKNWVFSQ